MISCFSARGSVARSVPRTGDHQIFLSTRFSRTASATTCLELAIFAAQVLDFRRRRFACRIAQQPLLAGLKEFFAPAVIEIRRQAFAAAERREALFPAESHSPHSIPPTPLLCFSIHVTSSPFSDHVCSHALFHAMRHLPVTWTVAPIMSGDFIRRIRWKRNVQIKSLPKPISPKRRRR